MSTTRDSSIHKSRQPDPPGDSGGSATATPDSDTRQSDSDTRHEQADVADSDTTADRLLTVGEVARRMGKSERSVQRYVRRGRLPASASAGGVFRIRESALVAFQATGDTDTADMSATQSPHATSRDTRRVAVATDVGDRPDPHVAHTVTVDLILPRYEAAVMRVGWLEGQLDMAQRMLGDGGHREAGLRAQAEAEAKARQVAEVEAQVERERATQAERKASEATAELETTRQRLAEMEQQARRPWWRRLLT